LANDAISFNGKDYIKDEIVAGEGYELKRLGDICKIQNGCQLNKKNIVEGEYPVFAGGKKILGYHNEYNRENAVLITSVCNVGDVKYYEGRFWASRVITLNSKENIKVLNKYIAFIMQVRSAFLKNKQHGSCQSNIVKSKIAIMDIPIPKSPEKIQYWVDKISAPFNEKNEKQTLLKNLEQEVLDKIKYISDMSVKVPFNKFCEFGGGKMLSRSKFIQGEYPVIGGGIKPSGHHNEFNKPKNTILCSSSGNNAGYISRYNIEVWASDCFSIHSKVLNEDFIYYYLKGIQSEIFKLQNGSAQPHVHSKDIKMKIKIPNPDKNLITELEPKFAQIKQIKLDIKTAEARFEQYIQELGRESINN